MTEKTFNSIEEAKKYADKNWYLDKTTFEETLHGKIKAKFEE